MHFEQNIGTILPLETERDWPWSAACGKPGSIKLAILVVVGIVDAPNPGADPRLEFAVPQGINPRILLLNLVFDQRPGIWPQKVTSKPVGYTIGLPDCERYDQVHITGEGVTIDIVKY